jgi:phosphoglycerate kinase
MPKDSLATRPGTDDPFVVDHEARNVPDDARAMDIGPRTIDEIDAVLHSSKAVIWNGPAGYFEDPRFQGGSIAIANSLTDSGIASLVGGGDTLAALKEAKTESENIYICTGGGAMLTMLMGRKLVGVEALES